MNGSSCGVGRGRWGSRSPERKAPADMGEPAGWRLGPLGLKGACAVCRKANRPSAFCEGRWLAEDAVGAGPATGEMQQDRRGLVVCKECCIGKLGGQRCVWWDLCWNI